MRVGLRRSRPRRRQRPASEDTSPPPVPAAYRARNRQPVDEQLISQPPPIRPGRPGRPWWRRGLQRLGLIVLLLAAMFSAVNVLSLSTDVKVMTLGAGNNSLLRPTADYQAAAARQLSRSVWNRNKITVNADGLQRQLLQQFSELSSVTVTVPLLAHRPVVYVQPAQPALILVSGSNAFLVDGRGKALFEAASPGALHQPQLPVVNDQSGLTIGLNRQVITGDDIGFTQTVSGELAAKQFTVSGMVLPAAASELDVHLAGQPYFVKFNLNSNSAREQAGTFLATIAQLRSQNITPSQYVDVRVDGRAYYK